MLVETGAAATFEIPPRLIMCSEYLTLGGGRFIRGREIGQVCFSGSFRINRIREFTVGVGLAGLLRL